MSMTTERKESMPTVPADNGKVATPEVDRSLEQGYGWMVFAALMLVVPRGEHE